MIFRKLKISDAKEVTELICSVFNEFVAPDWSKKAVKDCLSEQSAEIILKRSKERVQLVAILDYKIVGIIEGKNNNRITRLFIDKKYQRKGIGSQLSKKLEIIFKGLGTKKILVHSSMHAIPFYTSFGFRKATRLIKSKGMVYQPMKKYLL